MIAKVRYFARMLAGASLSTTLGLPVLAQDQNTAEIGGGRSTFTTTIELDSGRNLDLSPGNHDMETRANGMLGYSYQKQTRQTELLFNAAIAPESNQDGAYPTVDLNINHVAARSKFNFGASYGEAKITDQSLGFDSDTGAVIEYDGTGTRVLRQFSAGMEGGIDTPFGYSLQANHSQVDYRGETLGDDYSPSKSTRIKGGLRADISSMTTLNLDASRNDYRSEGTLETHRITDLMTLGVMQRLDAVNKIGLSIGHQSVQTDRTTENDKRTGTVFGAQYSHDYALGTSGIGYDQYLTENGMRGDLVLNHSRETTVGKFSGSIGTSRARHGSADWIGTLAYDTTLLRNKMSVTFSRAVKTNDDGDDVVVSRLAGKASHDFSDVNGLDFGLMASSTQDTGNDVTRVDASIAYRHSLTRDVTIQAGLRVGVSQKSNEENADTQSLFMNITRQVTFLN